MLVVILLMLLYLFKKIKQIHRETLQTSRDNVCLKHLICEGPANERNTDRRRKHYYTVRRALRIDRCRGNRTRPGEMDRRLVVVVVVEGV